jgi:hypothetical protein
MRVSTPEESPAGSAHFIGEIDEVDGASKGIEVP